MFSEIFTNKTGTFLPYVCPKSLNVPHSTLLPSVKQHKMTKHPQRLIKYNISCLPVCDKTILNTLYSFVLASNWYTGFISILITILGRMSFVYQAISWNKLKWMLSSCVILCLIESMKNWSPFIGSENRNKFVQTFTVRDRVSISGGTRSCHDKEVRQYFDFHFTWLITILQTWPILRASYILTAPNAKNWAKLP